VVVERPMELFPKGAKSLMKIMPILVFLVVCFIFAAAIAGAQRLTAGYVSKDLTYLRVVRFVKRHIQSLRWIHEHRRMRLTYSRRNSAFRRRTRAAGSITTPRRRCIRSTAT